VAIHEVELLVPADLIPEELVVDLTGLDIGDAIHSADLALPAGAKLTTHDVVVASIATSSAMQSVEATDGEGSAEA
jgi:large subunit ribosomal protein L25